VRGVAASHVPFRSVSLGAILLACLTVLGSGPFAAGSRGTPQAQKPPANPQQVPTFRTEARLVRVDAYVTADGRAVEDLRPEDFDVLEDGVRQKVETFEYVRKGQVVAGRAPDEPEIVGRNFVLFIDTYHLPWVDRERLERRERATPDYMPEPFRLPAVLPPPIPGDEMFREALRQVVDRVVGDSDRVAVLTPDVWAASLSFVEKRSAIEELGTRSLEPYTPGQRPPELNHFEACFPDRPNIEETMRVRYRLYRTFTALGELVANLELVREERKGLLLVTRGWDPPPRIHNYRDPRSGMLGTDDTVCHAERLALADVDFQSWLRTITNDAKRANVAVYSLYAHPLVTYSRDGDDIDEDTRKYQRQWGDMERSGGERMLYNDFPAILHDRMLWHDTLTHLSKDTNGRAVLTKDDFEKGLKEIADGLASYYLLGYYSTNTKRDGAFRRITVNVRRKGTTIRARPGYRAVIPAEAEAAELAARPDLVPPAILAVLGPLAKMRSDVPFHVAVAPEWDQAAGGWRLRVIGEIDAQQARTGDWRQGWRAEVTVVPGGIALAGADAIPVKAGQAVFSIALPGKGTLGPGQYDLRVKALSAQGDAVADERATVTVPATTLEKSAFGEPLFSRRLNAPRTEFQPTADQRFSRREILLVEVPFAGSGEAPTLRLVDRQGRALGTELPTTVAERAGIRMVSAMIPLSNLVAGDYVIEIAATDKSDRKAYVAFRVVP
jgi:VWFA-related protein